MLCFEEDDDHVDNQTNFFVFVFFLFRSCPGTPWVIMFLKTFRAQNELVFNFTYSKCEPFVKTCVEGTWGVSPFVRFLYFPSSFQGQ